MKSEITIVVENGLTQDVYSTNKNIKVTIIDLDGIDFDERELLEKEIKAIRNKQFIIG